MEFRIADTFTDSLAHLTGEEQKAVKTTAFDLQLKPANPGMSFHKLDKARDRSFWSVRVSGDIRMIVHRSEAGLLLCYVGHHDKAYDWAERRKLETHPKTGAAQLVEIRETVQEVFVPVYVPKECPQPPKPCLFSDVEDDQLLGYGVPAEWLDEVRKATEDTLCDIAEHLPGEAAEALLNLATGKKPTVPTPVPGIDPFAHPDAQRRFRVMTSVEELERALEFPWDKWIVFLHPEQRQWVERDYAGPARVSGSAGTGKTIVALHRAVHLARAHPDSRVLLTTFSDTLANALCSRLKRLVSKEPRLAERLEAHSINAIGKRLYNIHGSQAEIASREVIVQLLKDAAAEVKNHKFSYHFLLTEWEQIVDAWQLETWEAYRDVARLGRKTRLSEPQRKVLWSIFERVRNALAARNLVTTAGLFTRLAAAVGKSKNPPFDYAVVDEAQDMGISHLRFLAALGGNRPNALFFAGDLGQRIFQQPFSWLALGVDIRGRSRTLRVNYRTSHQIRMQADRLLGPDMTDVDGNKEDRSRTVSVFNGAPPAIRVFKTPSDEIAFVAEWICECTKGGVVPHEFGIFVRSAAEMARAQSAVEKAGLRFRTLDDNVETHSGCVSVGTMHLAKGLEFRAVAVMACDDEIIPLQERIESVGDDADLKEVYDTERQLLYVACTRARDYLLVSGVEPASEFLDDLRI
ncbi:MAG: UvrD-helicase domain-containing protein [Candidatus Sumerlaeota bacterium]|nr:UvrD-helicase domain-containing protein [Candidatus Sumerlaeota bacterium]